MGFSFRSLYNDDGQLGQCSGVGLSTSGQISIPDANSSASPRYVTTGIPGPIKGEASVPATFCGLYGESDFYSLDALEPELGSQEETILASSPEAQLNGAASDEGGRGAQFTLRAIFATSDSLTLDHIAALTAKLSGVTSCIIKTQERAVLASVGLETVRLLENLSDIPRLEAFQPWCDLLDMGKLNGVMLRSETDPVSCFSHMGVTLMARHPDGKLEPGLWEKLSIITESTAELH